MDLQSYQRALLAHVPVPSTEVARSFASPSPERLEWTRRVRHFLLPLSMYREAYRRPLYEAEDRRLEFRTECVGVFVRGEADTPSVAAYQVEYPNSPGYGPPIPWGRSDIVASTHSAYIFDNDRHHQLFVVGDFVEPIRAAMKVDAILRRLRIGVLAEAPIENFFRSYVALIDYEVSEAESNLSVRLI